MCACACCVRACSVCCVCVCVCVLCVRVCVMRACCVCMYVCLSVSLFMPKFVCVCVICMVFYSGAALVLSIIGLRLLRGSYTELSRQHMIFIFTLFFFNFDYEHYSESLPLDYFVISLIFYKVGEIGACIWGVEFVSYFIVL